MKKATKILSLILCIAIAACLFTACGEKTGDNGSAKKPSHTVVISVENYGDITLALYEDYAPETVANFVKLAEEGFYDNTIFHRISKGFMIQGGGFSADNPDVQKQADTITGEFTSNGFTQNTISHKRGIISMARTSIPDSASSQFFICDADSTFLDGNYAAFGVVTEGMEVVDKIASCEVTYNEAEGANTLPVVYPVIKTITVK